MTRRLLVSVLAGLFLSSAIGTSAHAVQPDEAAAFVDSAIQDVYTAMAGKKLSHDERVAVLDAMIRRYANIEKTSETLIGPTWNMSSPSDQATFQQTLVAYMLALWSDPMGDITPGQKVSITSSVAHGDKVLVESAATAPHEDPTYLEWTVASTADGHPFIADVSVEGVSLVRMMRSDFSSVLFANAGRLDGLIAGMQRKIRSVN
ncbi:MAG TPA: ABC transporter substrate-binding protein [Alphaproteobacteria bacterium]|nr:ABC transporter substrate-binding protein [Alphaproteobacteria bacterium]